MKERLLSKELQDALSTTIDIESSSQLRARMLERIRASLNHPATASAPEELPLFLSQTPKGDIQGLIEKFSAETEKVGGQVARVNSGGEVREYIERLLLLNTGATVAVSNGPLVQELCIREWLLSRNTRVVSCLDEVSDSIQTSSDSQFRDDPTRELRSRQQYRRLLLECDLGVTSADYALADTGTLVLLSGGEQHRLISLLPPVHVCILEPARILPALSQLLTHVREEFYSRERPPQALTCITGPSRTADIEHTITMGVHGPKSLHVLIYSPGGDETPAEEVVTIGSGG